MSSLTHHKGALGGEGIAWNDVEIDVLQKELVDMLTEIGVRRVHIVRKVGDIKRPQSVRPRW